VGADGVILVEKSETADFRWRFFNADGSSAEMCGNGARCAARFACLLGICGPQVRFETEAGLVEARVEGVRVKVKMTDPQDLELDIPIHVSSGLLIRSRINTGSPCGSAERRDRGYRCRRVGRRSASHLVAPAGTNASLSALRSRRITIRTYERGVEGNPTCGTRRWPARWWRLQLSLASPVRVRRPAANI
jgi:diaminopimelate epimerase